MYNGQQGNISTWICTLYVVVIVIQSEMASIQGLGPQNKPRYAVPNQLLQRLLQKLAHVGLRKTVSENLLYQRAGLNRTGSGPWSPLDDQDKEDSSSHLGVSEGLESGLCRCYGAVPWGPSCLLHWATPDGSLSSLEHQEAVTPPRPTLSVSSLHHTNPTETLIPTSNRNGQHFLINDVHSDKLFHPTNREPTYQSQAPRSASHVKISEWSKSMKPGGTPAARNTGTWLSKTQNPEQPKTRNGGQSKLRNFFRSKSRNFGQTLWSKVRRSNSRNTDWPVCVNDDNVRPPAQLSFCDPEPQSSTMTLHTSWYIGSTPPSPVTNTHFLSHAEARQSSIP